MPGSKAEYELYSGYVHDWLVAGPLAVPVTDLDRFTGADYKLQIARHYYDPAPGIVESPMERDKPIPGNEEIEWRYVRCVDDHLVDVSGFYHTCHYLRTWAYVEVECAEAQEVTAVLTTNGPADVWLNGEHVHRQEHFHHQIPHSVSFRAALRAGNNQVLVRFEEVASRECPYVMALELPGLPVHTRVLVPVCSDELDYRRRLEQTFAAAYLDRDVYAEDERVIVRWPEEFKLRCQVAARLQQPSGWIYAEAPDVTAESLASITFPSAIELPDGPFQVLLMPPARNYYEHNVRITRTIPLHIAKGRYSTAPYGTFAERREEALILAARVEGNVFAEIAKMALGRWGDVDTSVIEKAIAGINERRDCSDFYLVGLLGMMIRYGADPAFPEKLKQPLEECVLNFRYWMDEPGADAMCFWSENHQILFHTCEVLAGQLYPDRVFPNVGQTGRWHREKGERLALAWLRKRGLGGFREWDSNCYFEEDLLALSHLADLAENEEVLELASVVMDKMFFTMAVNSFRGVFGSTHGRTYTQHIRGGRLESTAGISRLMWGMGVFNERILGTVSLACAESYELPEVIAQIATDQPEAMWSRERHAGELEQACDCDSGHWEVNKVTYKTPDYMLCSAQDYHPGEPGYQQHIWQATLGPDAVVFVNHPPCLSPDGSHRPNLWHGNVVLPRVAQWGDVLIAVHNIPDDDWLGFTHAYFPIHAFDGHAFLGRWAFARVGEGYLAITAMQGIALTTRGDLAYRELRSYGQQNIWLVQMGRAAIDGSFGDFQDKVVRLEAKFENLSVEFNTLRGETLRFGWEGPFLLNGREQPISGFRHYEGPYSVTELGAPEMEICYGEQGVRLSFA